MNKQIMHHKNRRYFNVMCFICILFMLSFVNNTNAQGVMVTYSHNISSNPFKLAMGLINLEYEYVLTDQISVRLSTEFMIGDGLLFRNVDHPKLFTDLGFRYYLQKDDEYAINGFFLGTSFGHLIMHLPGSINSFTFGLESGYRINIPNQYYFTPRISGYYQFQTMEILPGAELRFGTSF